MYSFQRIASQIVILFVQNASMKKTFYFIAKSNMKKIVFSLTILIVLAFTNSFLFGAPSAQENKKQDRPRVSLEEIKPQKDSKHVYLPVKVEPKIQSLVSADVEGNVTRILKPLGATVKAGDVVLFLENKDPGFTYAPVPVRAPVSGTLSQFWTSQMSKVSRGDKLFTVINPNSLKLTGEFPNSDLNFARPGMTGKLVIDSLKSAEFNIRLVGVSPLLDPRTGTASAEFEFVKIPAPQKDKHTNTSKKQTTEQTLPSVGSVGQAHFEIDQGEVIIIPEAALIYRDGKPLVRILQGTDQFTKKPIDLGEQRDSNYVVKSGISKGEKIIVRSSRPLKDGEIIEIEAATPAAKTE